MQRFTAHALVDFPASVLLMPNLSRTALMQYAMVQWPAASVGEV
jgi:hypothetical protein